MAPVTSRRELIAGFSATLVLPTLLGCRGKGRDVVIARDEGAASITTRIAARPTTDGAGATLRRVFPGPTLRHLDPFVLLDDFDVREPAGFPDHPHRGFEAFTYMIAGTFHHRDNLGNDSEIAAGGTQRFTSGRGARHSEMPGPGTSNRGLQLWVNLEAARKQMDPQYEGIAGGDMPVHEADGRRVRTIVGGDSPARLHTDVDYLDVTLLADGSFERQVRGDHSGLVYVLDGSVAIGDERIEAGNAVVLAPGIATIRGEADARFAWLTGRPHGQPIRQRGPFVD